MMTNDLAISHPLNQTIGDSICVIYWLNLRSYSLLKAFWKRFVMARFISELSRRTPFEIDTKLVCSDVKIRTPTLFLCFLL